MTDLRKAAEMALEALEDVFDLEKKDVAAIQALRQALAQPVDAVNTLQKRVDETAKREHEPVAWVYRGNFHPFDPSDWAEGETATPLYTAPPKKEWVGLTDDERSYYLQSAANVGWWQASLFIEAQLKEKNT